MGVRFCEVVIMVKDFHWAKKFYEKLFENESYKKLRKIIVDSAQSIY